jgi:hypothetical protein
MGCLCRILASIKGAARRSARPRTFKKPAVYVTYSLCARTDVNGGARTSEQLCDGFR